MAFGDPICNPVAFRAAARYQGVCANCGSTGPFHAHHVLDAQTLRREYGIVGKFAYDTRNALRLCESLPVFKNLLTATSEEVRAQMKGRCHLQFENRRFNFATKKLTDENLEYVFEVMKQRAPDWLRQEYDDSDPDPRIIQLESEPREAA